MDIIEKNFFIPFFNLLLKSIRKKIMSKIASANKINNKYFIGRISIIKTKPNNKPEHNICKIDIIL